MIYVLKLFFWKMVVIRKGLYKVTIQNYYNFRMGDKKSKEVDMFVVIIPDSRSCKKLK